MNLLKDGKCSLPHAAMHVIHLIILRDFALLMSLLNYFILLINYSYNSQRSLHNSRPEKDTKKVRKTQKTTPNHRDADSHGTNIIT